MPRTAAQTMDLIVVMRAEFPAEGRSQVPTKTAIGTVATVEDAQAAVSALAAGEVFNGMSAVQEAADDETLGIQSDVAFYWTRKTVKV